MENLHGNVHVFVLSCLKFPKKTQNIHVFMYFRHLVPPLPPPPPPLQHNGKGSIERLLPLLYLPYCMKITLTHWVHTGVYT